MHSKTSRLAAALVLSSAMTASSVAYADDDAIEVTITNLTQGQVFAPPLVVVHNKNFSLFADGGTASDGLALLAEEGNASLLETEVLGAAGVDTTAIASGAIMPGTSHTVTIYDADSNFVSVAGMLVTTNDAFFAVRGLRLRGANLRTASAPAYDAGSEVNDQLCVNIPGPPCAGDSGNGGVAEGDDGVIHIHNGIHGPGELDGDVVIVIDEATSDWRNPVARVTIRRLDD